MSSVFRVTQTNGFEFRAQVVGVHNKPVLWIAESEDQIYVVEMDAALRADTYQPQIGENVHQALLLYVSGDEVETVEIGSFTHETALRFLAWLQEALAVITPAASSAASSSRG